MENLSHINEAKFILPLQKSPCSAKVYVALGSYYFLFPANHFLFYPFVGPHPPVTSQ